MDESSETFQSDHLRDAWNLLEEYYDFCRLAHYRRKLEEQLQNAQIPLTRVSWKKLARRVLCSQLFSEDELKEINGNSEDCCIESDIVASQAVVNKLLESRQEDGDREVDLTNAWSEVNELKQRFQKAASYIPSSRQARKDMCRKIQGYPAGYVDEHNDLELLEQRNDNQQVDLTRVLTSDEQHQMDTGDLIEMSGYRLHNAFYIYRLPQKGIWSQIQQMWSNHQITDFVFNDVHTNTDEGEEGDILFVPAKDEYGYGVPYLFATRANQSLPDGALYKYVDINCPLVARHTQNPTIALVEKHLSERLQNPVYQDEYIGVEMTVEPNRFPQEYVAIVHINHDAKDNVTWTRLAHYNGREAATDLNDNREIFYSRRVLEAEEQYRQKYLSK
ncbi:unnamed protein product [Adineta ricciae]|uniref:Uncharacterized protein n=1 Tax=Adineta ricciae TaxID=249248 RepID=A0A814TTG7_ADIRI|nr:unnamed protein product [Adineta ricciae]CAF1166581.1 unnamed protein product [Adineta ricciae]